MNEEHHKEFQERLRSSDGARQVLKRWLQSRGWHSFELPELRVSPTAARHAEFADHGDMFACLEKGNRLRLECKRLGVAFARSWPFRDVIVCSEHSWRNLDSVPYCYYYFSKNLRSVGVYRPRPDKMKVFVRRDSKRGENFEQRFMVDPDPNAVKVSGVWFPRCDSCQWVDVESARRGWIRTECQVCWRFIGWRPADAA